MWLNWWYRWQSKLGALQLAGEAQAVRHGSGKKALPQHWRKLANIYQYSVRRTL